jgi:biotin transport system substrate-specific component
MKKNLVYSALILSGLIATGGLSLNIGPVPLTFQVFFVIFAGLFLPKNYSFVPAAMYLIMGGLGLPVFAGFSSGFEHFISPTGGYLISFPIASFLISLLHTKDSNLSLFLSSFVGLSVIYIIGIFGLTFYTKSLLLSLKFGFFPFIWVDVLKIFISVYVYKRVKKALLTLTNV